MLDPCKDRLDYTADLFRPPDGFKFERAVATTYSLDLMALVAALIPLVLGEEPDDSACGNPLLVWRAFKAAAGRVAVFHEDGQIAVPRGTPERLLALLAEMAVPVRLEDKHRENDDSRPFPAFHPKTWSIVFKKNGGDERKVRFCVLSRNLTFDRSWDLSVSFDSGTNARQTRKTKPLAGFFDFLRRHANHEAARNVVAEVADAFASHPLVRDKNSSPWTDFDILPLLGNNHSADKPNPFLDDPLLGMPTCGGLVRDAVVMSPFLSKSTIRQIRDRIEDPKSRRCALLTRREALVGFTPEDFGGLRVFALKDAEIGSETIPESGSGEADTPPPGFPARDIHAKFYFWRRGGEASLLLGSANATDSAFHRNVEMIVRLHARWTKFSGEELLADLFLKGRKGETNPFEEIPPEEWPAKKTEGADDRRAAELAIKRFCRANPRARVERRPDGTFSLLLVADRLSEAVDVRPYLAQDAERNRTSDGIRFSGIALADLADLYLVSSKRGGQRVERLVRIPTKGIPAAERDGAVEREFVERSGGIENWLAVLFAENPGLVARRIRPRREGESADGRRTSGGHAPGLYEKMLRATADPERFAASFAEAERLLENDTATADGSGSRKLLRELIVAFRAAAKRKGVAK